MAKIIDGKSISAEIRSELAAETARLAGSGIQPCLAVIIAGDDPASRIYVNNKKKACGEIGIKSLEFALSASVSQNELSALIERLNADPDVHGILCQLPLPAHLDEKAVINSINPSKDVDAFHPQNVGHIMIGDYDLLPCTPAGVMELLSRSGIDVCSKHCVVIGRSNIVGKPMALLLLHQNATVTVCHSKTENLAAITAQADVLISAVGRANFVTAAMVKPGAAVIDVGMNRLNGKLCGDVDYDEVSKKAGFITPVPGGVGPMTIAMLMKNTLTSAKNLSK